MEYISVKSSVWISMFNDKEIGQKLSHFSFTQKSLEFLAELSILEGQEKVTPKTSQFCIDYNKTGLDKFYLG